jgi:DNA polymerase alpha subunit A
MTMPVRQMSDDKVPDVPSSDLKQGTLPRLIATLVNRRKQVKSLMKDKSAPASKQLQVSVSAANRSK